MLASRFVGIIPEYVKFAALLSCDVLVICVYCNLVVHADKAFDVCAASLSRRLLLDQ